MPFKKHNISFSLSAIVGFFIVGMLSSSYGGGAGRRRNAQSSTRRPNIVILMSDDQDVMLGSMDVMHFTRKSIVKKGATFHNAFTTSPICCPSRSSFLTGIYSHNHNVLTNNDNCSSPLWQKTHETRTFATHLNASGYNTGYFGKYLNEYNGSYTPPGWQYWMGLIKNTKYYNYSLLHNGQKEQHRDDYEKDYLTDLIINRSMSYFRQEKIKDSSKPVLTFLSFPAPHGSEDSAPQYQHLYANVSSHITPSFDYVPNPDKHWIISQVKEPMDDTQHRFSALLQQKRLQTLRSVDDGVERFVQMLNEIEELDNTYILYTSDHGYHIGQFGLAKGKSMPYDFDIRVPFYLRGPGIPIGTTINDIVLNIDIAPTILGMAGLEVPETMDGRNFMPLIKNRSSISPPWRDTFLIERGRIPHSKIHMEKPKIPSKQEKVKLACQREIYKYPCDPGQDWTCAYDDGILKMRKCNKFKSPTRKPPRNGRPCLCPKRASLRSNRLSVSCQHRIHAIWKNSRSNKHRYNRESAKQKMVLEVLDDYNMYGGNLQLSKNLNKHAKRRRFKRRAQEATPVFMKQGKISNVSSMSRNERRVSPGCKINIRTAEIFCEQGGPLKPEHLRRNIQDLKEQMRFSPRPRDKHFPNCTCVCYVTCELCSQPLGCTSTTTRLMKVLASCTRPLPKRMEKCKCRSQRPRVQKKKKENQNNGTNVHPMKAIFQEIRKEHNDRLQTFKEKRREHASMRILKKEKSAARKLQRIKRCSNSQMTCFRLFRDRWITNPIWDGPERCYCNNARNNTYWCIRTINATSNLLYCEFITGFVEYYDLLKDPHQLSNTYHDLSRSVHTALNAELAQLRVCKGERQCHIARESSQSVATTTTTRAVTTTITTTERTTTQFSTEMMGDPEQDVVPDTQTTTVATTNNHIPTNYPPGTNYGDLRRRPHRRPAFVSCGRLKINNPKRWLKYCHRKRQSILGRRIPAEWRRNVQSG